MKIVGIIGGIGPESTIEYYRLIIASYREQKQDGSYPAILINSIDLKKMLDLIEADALREVTTYLVGNVLKLASDGLSFCAGRNCLNPARCQCVRHFWIRPEGSNLPSSVVAALEQELRASLEGLGPRHEPPEGAGQPIDRVEGEADRERVLDLLARDAGGQHRAHVVRGYCVLTRQLAQHAQRGPKRLFDDRGLEVGKHRGDLRFIPIRHRRDCAVRLHAHLALVRLRHDGAHQLAVSNRPCRWPAHRLLSQHPHRHAIEIRAVAVSLDGIGYLKARDRSHDGEQALRPEIVAAIEYREAHSHSFAF